MFAGRRLLRVTAFPLPLVTDSDRMPRRTGPLSTMPMKIIDHANAHLAYKIRTDGVGISGLIQAACTLLMVSPRCGRDEHCADPDRGEGAAAPRRPRCACQSDLVAAVIGTFDPVGGPLFRAGTGCSPARAFVGVRSALVPPRAVRSASPPPQRRSHSRVDLGKREQCGDRSRDRSARRRSDPLFECARRTPFWERR